MGFHPLTAPALGENLGPYVVSGSDPRLGSLASGPAGLKWNHCRVPWGTLQQEGEGSGYKGRADSPSL